MNNRAFRFGPIALTTTLTTNILNPATTTGGVNSGSNPLYIILRSVTIVNRTGLAATFSLWLGATGANTSGTEVIGGTGQNVPANGFFTRSCYLRLDSTDFLVGGSNTATALTIEGEGEIGVAG